MKTAAILILSCLLAAFVAHAEEPKTAAPAATAKHDASSIIINGQIAPAFTLVTLDGKTVGPAELKGKVVLLNFFATWCGPCMAEMPHLEKEIWPKFKDANFILISVGREHNASELKAFRDKKHFTFPIAPDPKREVYGMFAKQYIPRNYVIDTTGKVAYQSTGFSNDISGLKEAIERALGNK